MGILILGAFSNLSVSARRAPRTASNRKAAMAALDNELARTSARRSQVRKSAEGPSSPRTRRRQNNIRLPNRQPNQPRGRLCKKGWGTYRERDTNEGSYNIILDLGGATTDALVLGEGSSVKKSLLTPRGQIILAPSKSIKVPRQGRESISARG
jgi:hypothetical protein